jgi:hypothetical protein
LSSLPTTTVKPVREPCTFPAGPTRGCKHEPQHQFPEWIGRYGKCIQCSSKGKVILKSRGRPLKTTANTDTDMQDSVPTQPITGPSTTLAKPTTTTNIDSTRSNTTTATSRPVMTQPPAKKQAALTNVRGFNTTDEGSKLIRFSLHG